MKKKIAIVGLGESGVGAAILAQKQGFDVWATDNGPVKSKYKQMLDAHGIAWEENGHTVEQIFSADEIVRSPGIPQTVPLICEARAKGISIISEIELAARYTDAKLIAVTGSNGKTTTTILIHHLLIQAGVNAAVAGNIGKSLALLVAEDPHDVYVIELSSFQLEDMYDFHADIALLLNITPDHLNRYHNDINEYAQAKFRINRNQGPKDAFIYWKEDALTREELSLHPILATTYAFSLIPQEGVQAYLKEDKFCVRLGKEDFEMPRVDFHLPGNHNVLNALVAILATRLFGLSYADIRIGLLNFDAVEHRMEKVCTFKGCLYVNDSKATNLDACRYALEGTPAPVVLILGGVDKGNDYKDILPLVKEKVVAMVYLGIDNHKLHASFDNEIKYTAEASSMMEAIDLASHWPIPQGSTILLSPCCASFDLFNSYEDRGEQFKECVQRLKEKE